MRTAVLASSSDLGLPRSNVRAQAMDRPDRTRPRIQSPVGGSVGVEPAAQPLFRNLWIGDDRVECRHLDAGRRRRSADDLALPRRSLVALVEAADSIRSCWRASSGGAGGHRRSASPADRHSGLSAGRCRRARHPDLAGPDDRLGVARVHLRTRRRRSDDDAGVGGNRAGSRSDGQAAIRRRLEQCRHQRLAGDRTGDCGDFWWQPSGPGSSSC